MQFVVAGMLIRRLESDLAGSVEEHSSGQHAVNDQFAGERFHYCRLSNPPFGKKWEKDKTAVEAEHKRRRAGPVWSGPAENSAMAPCCFLHLGEQKARTADQQRWPRRYCAVRFATV